MKSPSLSIPVGQEPFPVSLIPFSPPPFLLIRFPGDDLQEALEVPQELRAELSLKIDGGRHDVYFHVSVGIPISKGGLFSKLADVGKALSRQGQGEAFGRFYPEDFGYWMKNLTPKPNSEKSTLLFDGGFRSSALDGEEVARAIKYLIPIFGPQDDRGVLYDSEGRQRRERFLSGDEEEFERVAENLWIVFASSLRRMGGVRKSENYLHLFSGKGGPGSYVIFSYSLEEQMPPKSFYPNPLQMGEKFVSEDDSLIGYLGKYKKSNLLLFVFFKVRFEDFGRAFRRSFDNKKFRYVSNVEVPIIGILSSRSYESQISFKDFLDKTRKEKHEFVKLSSSLGKLAVFPEIYRKFSYGIYAFSSVHAKDLGNPGFSVYRGSQDEYEDRVVNLDEYGDKQKEEPPLFSPSSKDFQSPLISIVDGFLGRAIDYHTTSIASEKDYSPYTPRSYYLSLLKTLDPYYVYALHSSREQQQVDYPKDYLHPWRAYIQTSGTEDHSVSNKIPKLVVFLVSALSSGAAEPLDVLASYQRIFKVAGSLKEVLAKKGVSYDATDYKFFQKMFHSYIESVLNLYFWRGLSPVLLSLFPEQTSLPDTESSPCFNGSPIPIFHILFYDDPRKSRSYENILSEYASSLFLHQYILWFMERMKEINGVSHKFGSFGSSGESARLGLYFSPYKDGNLRVLFVDMGSSGAVRKVVPINIGKVPSVLVAIFDDSGDIKVFDDSMSYENKVSFSWSYDM